MPDFTPTTLSIPVTEKDHIRGDIDAPLTLLEYGDYECDYCGRAFPIVKTLRERFGPRLRFVFRNFPHASIHPHASVAAEAAESAGSQGKYWEMHDLLYAHQDGLAESDLTHYALQIGLEPYHFQSDLSSRRFAKRVEADYAGGVANGVHKTPTFYINGRRYDGAMDLAAMTRALEDATG